MTSLIEQYPDETKAPRGAFDNLENIRYLHLRSPELGCTHKNAAEFGGMTVAYRLFQARDYLGRVCLFAQYGLSVAHESVRYVRAEGRKRAAERIQLAHTAGDFGGIEFLGYGVRAVSHYVQSRVGNWIPFHVVHAEHPHLSSEETESQELTNNFFIKDSEFDLTKHMRSLALTRLAQLQAKNVVTGLMPSWQFTPIEVKRPKKKKKVKIKGEVLNLTGSNLAQETSTP